MDDETTGTTDDEINSMLDKSDYSTDDTNNAEILSNDSDGDTDGEAWLSDNEEQCPLEYYPAEASSLDVKRLWQR